MSNTTANERRYVPMIGARVLLKLFSDYAPLGLSPWTTLHVTGIDGEQVVCVRSLTGSEGRDGELVTVSLDRIAPPIGWSPRYTIHVKPEQVDEVLGWFTRGISVRQSQYIGDSSVVFQPNDANGQPHWKYGELTDVVLASQCNDVFRVVKLEVVSDAFVPAPCRYCEGTGKHTSNPALVSQSASTLRCSKCGLHIGFSFTEPYHDSYASHEVSVPCEQKHIRAAGECWVCNGTGQGARYFSEMDKKERKIVTDIMSRAGWKVWYQRSVQIWWMERETVVKEWRQNAGEVQA